MQSADGNQSLPAAASAPQPRPRGRKPRKKLQEDFVLGLRRSPRSRSSSSPCAQRYPHPNRVLFYDDLLVALLLAFFNPVARSLRGIEDASQTPGVRQHLDIDTLHRSTVSEAMALFDPQLLVPLVAQIRRNLPDSQLDNQDHDLRGLLNRLRGLRRFLLSPSRRRPLGHFSSRHGRLNRVRGQVRSNLPSGRHVPGMIQGITISGQDDPSEPMALLDGVVEGDILVADRGCFSHQTVHELLQAKADMVLRSPRRWPAPSSVSGS